MRQAATLCAAWSIACAAMAGALDVDFERQGPSVEARELAQWALASGDTEGRPFLIVDKKAARLFVFQAGGKLLAATPVLLGSAMGDYSAPGVGERAQTGTLTAQDRTTPAGRFVTQPGVNLDGEHVVWLDYDAALALHRLRPGRSYRVRAARLKDSQPHERRMSLGCVVVPTDFYLEVVQPLLGSRSGVVYVLPETQDAREVFLQL